MAWVLVILVRSAIEAIRGAIVPIVRDGYQAITSRACIIGGVIVQAFFEPRKTVVRRNIKPVMNPKNAKLHIQAIESQIV
jgi:hypothetical protein